MSPEPRRLPAITLLTTGAAILLGAEQLSPETGRWLQLSFVQAGFVLPGLALGVFLSRHGTRLRWAGVALWGMGIGLGQLFALPVMKTMGHLPHAELHHFLLFPVALLVLGLPQIAGGRLAAMLMPPAALIAGTGYGTTVALFDPGAPGEFAIPLTASLLGLWLVLAAMALAEFLPQRVRRIGGRILGSWLTAIGLLYGGLAVMGPLPKLQVISPPSDGTTGSLPAPDSTYAPPVPGLAPQSVTPGISRQRLPGLPARDQGAFQP